MGCGTSKPPPHLRRPPSSKSSSSSSSKSSISSHNKRISSHNINENKREEQNNDQQMHLMLVHTNSNENTEEQSKDEKTEGERRQMEMLNFPGGKDTNTDETNYVRNDDTTDTSNEVKENVPLVIEMENKPEDNEVDNKSTEKQIEEDNTQRTEPSPGEIETEKETTEKSTEDTTERPTEETTERPTEETTERPTEETTERPTEETTERPTEETTEKCTDETTEKPTEETIEQKIDETTEKPTEEDTENELPVETTEVKKETDEEGLERSATVEAKVEEDFEDIDDGYDDLYTPFDDEDEEDLEVEGYVQNDLGLMIQTVTFLKDNKDEADDERPVVQPGELYTDKDFPLEIAIVQDSSGLEWKRPGEFLSEPVLFHENTTRFDIGQGSAGTCWFLSTVSALADNADMINQIVPRDAYNIDNSEAYDGVFHARFYRFGKWEDVYIDDYIPIVHGSVPWGAKSSTNENEVWVSLLEKAFARMHGSYDSIYGGQPGDAYLQLTGGIGERVEIDDGVNQDKKLFQRVTNALKSGCQVTCVVPDEYDDYMGLVGGHAYSLVATTVVNNTKLCRVRNPWGKGEWKGAWSDESPEFEYIQSSNERVPQKDDGEFYISLADFTKYFSQTTICSLTPDFDCDGKADPMNFVMSVYGEWTEEKMGGFKELLNNPRFSFTVTDEGMLEDGTVPLLIQIIQHTEKRKARKASIRCDIFKIKADKIKPTGRTIAAEIQGKKNNVYTSELQSSFRHKLKPGRYMAIPSTCNENIQKAFLLRIFTPGPLKNCKEIGMDTNILSCENEESLSHGGSTYELTFDKTMFGAFISGVNAGGQVSNRDTYSINPQYLLSIPNTGKDVPLVVHIMQTQEEPQYPVGFRLFNLDKGINPPVNVDYLYDKYNSSPTDIEGQSSKFMISWDVDARYLLPAGRYVALIHMDQPDTEKAFAIVFKSNTNIGIKGLQTGE